MRCRTIIERQATHSCVVDALSSWEGIEGKEGDPVLCISLSPFRNLFISQTVAGRGLFTAAGRSGLMRFHAGPRQSNNEENGLHARTHLRQHGFLPLFRATGRGKKDAIVLRKVRTHND
jgi:hypothetical protein